MRKPLLILLAVACLGAAPSRTQTYVAGQVINPAHVTENEDNIYSYLQAGVDEIRANAVVTGDVLDGTLVNADLSSTAAIALSKLASCAAAQLVLGNASGVPTCTTLASDATIDSSGNLTIANNSVDGTDIAFGSDAQGDVYYYNGTDVVRLGAGTSGFFLKTNGASSNPAWASALESGTWGSDLAGGTRAAASIYQNTSGKKRRISVRVEGDNASRLISFVEVGSGSPPTLITSQTSVDDAADTKHVTSHVTEVPDQWYYRLTITNGALLDWYELDE